MGELGINWELTYPIVLGGIIVLGLLGGGLIFLSRFIKGRIASESDQKSLQHLTPLEQIRQLNLPQFECFITGLFQKMGYLTHLTPSTEDETGDIVAVKDGQKHLIGCNGYRTKKICLAEVRNFYKTLANHSAGGKGIFVTTGIFTLKAEKFAANKSIELVDGTRLINYMKTVGIIKQRPSEVGNKEGDSCVSSVISTVKEKNGI